jgi:hypothetical protein
VAGFSANVRIDEKPRDGRPAMSQLKVSKIIIFGFLFVILASSIVQQVRYPDSAAWIVAVLTAGYLLLAFIVNRLSGRRTTR